MRVIVSTVTGLWLGGLALSALGHEGGWGSGHGYGAGYGYHVSAGACLPGGCGPRDLCAGVWDGYFVEQARARSWYHSLTIQPSVPRMRAARSAPPRFLSASSCAPAAHHRVPDEGLDETAPADPVAPLPPLPGAPEQPAAPPEPPEPPVPDPDVPDNTAAAPHRLPPVEGRSAGWGWGITPSGNYGL